MKVTSEFNILDKNITFYVDGISKFNNLTYRLVLRPDGEGDIRMVRMVGG